MDHAPDRQSGNATLSTGADNPRPMTEHGTRRLPKPKTGTDWIAMAGKCLDDVAVVTTVLVGFIAISAFYEYLSFAFGGSAGSALTVLVSCTITAVAVTLWALWTRLIAWSFQRFSRPAGPWEQPAAPADEPSALQVILGTRVLPSFLVVAATIVGFALVPADSDSFGIDIDRMLMTFYLVVICIAPLRRLIVERLVHPPRDRSISAEDSTVTTIFE